MRTIIKLIVSELVFIIGYVLSIISISFGLYFMSIIMIIIGVGSFIGVSKNVYKLYKIFKKKNIML
jgi:hypothetical protein